MVMRFSILLLLAIMIFACNKSTDKESLLQKYMLMYESNPDSTLTICQDKLQSLGKNSRERAIAGYISAKILSSKDNN